MTRAACDDVMNVTEIHIKEDNYVNMFNFYVHTV